MSPKTKKIYLLLAGGSALDDKDILSSSVNKDQDIADWLKKIPELGLIAQIQPIFISNGSDGLHGVKLWQKLGQAVFENYNNADGFVITGEVEEIQEIGIALSFILENLAKPVILTGSQITESNVALPEWSFKKNKAYGGLGIKANLINAVQVATMEVSGVSLMFGSRIVRAVKAERSQLIGLNLFSSTDDSYIGKIDFGITLTEKPSKGGPILELKNHFFENLNTFEYTSLIADWRFVERLNSPAIIKNWHNIEFLKKFKISHPLIIYNQHLIEPEPQVNLFFINNLTWPTALIKTAWALAQEGDWQKNLGKEYCKEFLIKEK